MSDAIYLDSPFIGYAIVRNDTTRQIRQKSSGITSYFDLVQRIGKGVTGPHSG